MCALRGGCGGRSRVCVQCVCVQCVCAWGRQAGAIGGEAGGAAAEPEAGGLLQGVADGVGVAVVAVAVDAQGGVAGAFAVAEGEGVVVVAAVAEGGGGAVPAAGEGVGVGYSGRCFGGGGDRDAVCVRAHVCYDGGEIE